MEQSRVEWSGIEHSETKIPFNCLEILGQNKVSCLFFPNRRGKNRVISDGMEWNL